MDAPNNTSATTPKGSWTSLQAYALALVCLVIGLPFGYLLDRTTAKPVPMPAPVVQAAENPHAAMQQMPPAAQQMPKGSMPAAMTKKLEELEAKVKSNPKDTEALRALGNFQVFAHKFDKAVEYYQQALAVNPESREIRTDLGSAYYYMGDADKAIKEFETVLKKDPGYADALYNLGAVQFRAKQDPAAAAATWERLIKSNPQHPKRAQVEQMLAKAKAHIGRS